MKTVLPRLTGLLVLAATQTIAAPRALEESEVIEVVNDVTLITMPDGHAAPARLQDHLHAPDRLRTGRASRAELQAPDGTITRLGSNTLFAFDRATRAMQLDRGSVLFHSPSGRGGGTIKSPSASASVLGTTIIAAATTDGGFKLLVLEGRAQVDFNSGARRELDAGQMLFVRPGGLGTGTPGPTLHFDLERQVKDSKLVKGFKRPLASQPKIDRAIADQQRAVGQGHYLATGFLVYSATSDTQVNGIEAAGPDADDNLVGDFNQHQRLALNSAVVLDSPTLPNNRVFRSEFLIPASESEFLNLESDTLLTGLLGLRVDITTPELSLAAAGVSAFNFVGKEYIAFAGSTTFTDLADVNYLRLFSPQVIVPAGAAIIADFPVEATPTTFYVDTDLTLLLAGGSVSNTRGGLLLQSHGGDLIISDELLHAGDLIGADSVVPSAVNIDAPHGLLDVSGSEIRSQGGTFAALAADLALRDTHFLLEGDFWADSGDTARLDGLTWQVVAPEAVFQTTAVNLIEARLLDFAGFATINLGARTIALTNVAFPADSVVRLVSETGQLAPNPNTNATVQPGFVNFVRDVTYDGAPAQDHVSTAAGGTGRAAPTITITTPNPGNG
ncbi:FecR family protein [Actomonas aquatica]|uniref:FecR family protein n=1 Tax=Actomonas aquatica TaxID=2866162 RepID=A0ABZ1C7I1_9BACT|nr:FecR family protein [Opitutus sp. WL0086]WRQ87218.1 FecR family protein [Opitutus sp. WL0086]